MRSTGDLAELAKTIARQQLRQRGGDAWQPRLYGAFESKKALWKSPPWPRASSIALLLAMLSVHYGPDCIPAGPWK